MYVTYLEKGQPFDFKRIDRVKTIYLSRTFESGGLLYGYVDRYNVKAIAKEDIISIQKESPCTCC